MIIHKAFYMIRHGETEANAAKIMAGSLDSPLTDKGRAQAAAARDILEQLKRPPAVIVHSQLSRARETAEIMNSNLKAKLIEDADLAEMHAGDWEGTPYDQCRAMLDGWQDPPGGETFANFLSRVKAAKNRALAKYQDERDVLFVCHGGVFRAFAKLYDVDIWGVRNCELHEFTPAPQKNPFPWTAHIYLEKQASNPVLSDSFHNEETSQKKYR
jgi:broad specificity phosphatase PhoE